MKIYTKTIFFTFCFLLFFVVSGFAATVTIGEAVVKNWRYGGTTAKLRLYASEQFSTSDGRIVMAGNISRGSWYREVPIAINGNSMTIAAVAVDSTTDSDRPTATYTAVFFDSKNIRRDEWMTEFSVPASFGASVTWTQLRTYNDAYPRSPPTLNFYSTDQVNNLLNNLVFNTSGDMRRAIFDANLDNIVDTAAQADNAARFDGQFASFYLNRANQTGLQSFDTLTGLTKGKLLGRSTDSAGFVKDKVEAVSLGAGFSIFGNVLQFDLPPTLEFSTNKGQINGYAALDSVGKVPAAQLPAASTSTSVAWGAITGTIGSQTDLQNILNTKQANIIAGLTTQYYRGDKTFQTLDKTAVGLSNVDNTTDALKPLSSAAVSALAAKQGISEKGAAGGYASLGTDGKVPSTQLPATAVASVSWGAITGTIGSQTDLQNILNTKQANIIAGLTTQYYRGDKTFQTLDKTAVGLSNVDNTTDALKPISNATSTALSGKQGISEKGAAGGYASLGTDGKVPSTQLPTSTGGGGTATLDTFNSASDGQYYNFDGNALSSPIAGLTYGTALLGGASSTGSTVVNQNARLEIDIVNAAGGGHGFFTTNYFDFTGKKVSAKFQQVVSNGNLTALAVAKDTQNYARMTEDSGLIYMNLVTNGAPSFTSVPYTANELYWRISQDSANLNIVFETSPDGITYTARRTVAATFSAASVRAGVDVRHNNGSAVRTAIIDDFKVEGTSSGYYSTLLNYQRLSYFNTLQDAVANAGNRKQTILVDVDKVFSGTVAIPENVILKPINGATITESATAAGTIRFLGVGVEASPETPIFRDFEPDDIQWRGNYPSFFSPVWFGAKGDGVNDDINAFDSTIEAMEDYPFDSTGIDGKIGGEIHIPSTSQRYLISRTWNITRPADIKGVGNAGLSSTIHMTAAGQRAIVFHRSAVVGGVLQTTLPAPPADGKSVNADGARISNLTITGTKGGQPSFTTSSSYGSVISQGLTHTGIVFTATSGVTGGPATTLNQAEFRNGQTFKFGIYTFIVDVFDQTVTAQKFLVKNPRFHGKVLANNPEIPGTIDKRTVVQKASYGNWDTNMWQGSTIRLGNQTKIVQSNDLDTMILTTPLIPDYQGDIEVVEMPAATRTFKQNTGHGVQAYTVVRAENLTISGFSGNGYTIDSDYVPTGSNATDANGRNANNSSIEATKSFSNDGHGFYISGFNSNVISIQNNNATNNAGYGFYTRDFHGSTYINNHAQANFQGAFGRGNLGLGAPSDTYIGNYTEGGDQPSSERGSCVAIGGTDAAGNSPFAQCGTIQAGHGGLTTNQISAITGPNGNLFPSVFTTGGNGGGGGNPNSGKRTLAGFGGGEEAPSMSTSGGNPYNPFASIFLIFGNTTPKFYTWEYDSALPSHSYSGGEYNLGGGWAAFTRGYLLGNIEGKKERLISSADAPPTTPKITRVITGTISGSTLTLTGGSKFDTETIAIGGVQTNVWANKAIITIAGIDYTVSGVTNETTLTLTGTPPAGATGLATLKIPYKKGDIFYNNDPDPGEYIGWTCTVGGIGAGATWKRFGLIEN